MSAKRGRPPDPAAQRVYRRFKRASVATALYRGVFPAELLPDGYEAMARGAVGNRDQADALAGELLNASAATIKHARRGTDGSRGGKRRLRHRFGDDDGLRSPPEPMTGEAFEEFIELLRIRVTGKLPE